MPEVSIPNKSTGDTLTATEFNSLVSAHNDTIQNSNPVLMFDVRQITSQYTHSDGDPVAFPDDISTNNWTYNGSNLDFEADSGVSGIVIINARVTIENPSGSEREYNIRLEKDTGSGFSATGFQASEDFRSSSIHTIGINGVEDIEAGNKLRIVCEQNGSSANPEILHGYIILQTLQQL